MVYYYIDWGDGQTTVWVGPYNSGAIATVSHQWTEEGTYTVQAKAKDTQGIESGWTTLEVTMPVSVEKYQATQLHGFFEHINMLLENLGLRTVQMLRRKPLFFSFFSFFQSGSQRIG